MSPEKFCLKWNDFQKNVSGSFRELREDTDFCDVTLASEGNTQITAHKVILAASSPIFQKLLKLNKHAHPLIYMRGVKSENLLAIVEFLYHGEANIYQENLEDFFAIAEEFTFKGLTGKTEVKQYILEQNVKQKITKHSLQRSPKVQNNQSTPKQSKDIETTKDIHFENIGKVENVAKQFFLPDHKVTTDFSELDEHINSMMTKGDEICPGRKEKVSICKVCGKEGQRTSIRDHIEANHIDGVSHSCPSCEKIFRSI